MPRLSDPKTHALPAKILLKYFNKRTEYGKILGSLNLSKNLGKTMNTKNMNTKLGKTAKSDFEK